MCEQLDILYIYPYFLTKTKESEHSVVIIPRSIKAGSLPDNQ
jgi:hypothetical protein